MCVCVPVLELQHVGPAFLCADPHERMSVCVLDGRVWHGRGWHTFEGMGSGTAQCPHSPALRERVGSNICFNYKHSCFHPFFLLEEKNLLVICPISGNRRGFYI